MQPPKQEGDFLLFKIKSFKNYFKGIHDSFFLSLSHLSLNADEGLVWSFKVSILLQLYCASSLTPIFVHLHFFCQVVSDATVDYLKMTLLNAPAALLALGL